jgi:hypothetical protein
MMPASTMTPTTTPAAMPAVLGPFFSGSDAALLATADWTGAAEAVGKAVLEPADEDDEDDDDEEMGSAY